MLDLADLGGLWTRSLIAWPDGTRDRTTAVAWLQGPTRYADLRQPVGLAACAGATCLRELDRTDVLSLADQEGFAGTFVQHADCFEWRRRIDYQPKPIYSDRGTLTTDGDTMIETGCDIPYVEHWHRAEGVRTPSGALDLQDAETGADAVLVRVGGHFIYARSRARALDESRPLRDYVREAATLKEAQDLVDCEISIGAVKREGWLITRSTLPYRVGATLTPRTSTSGLETPDIRQDGSPFDRRWTISANEGAFFDSNTP